MTQHSGRGCGGGDGGDAHSNGFKFFLCRCAWLLCARWSRDQIPAVGLSLTDSESEVWGPMAPLGRRRSSNPVDLPIASDGAT